MRDMETKIVFCDDDTCRFHNGIACSKDFIHIELKAQGVNDTFNVCKDYEDKRNDRESNGT